MIYYIFYKIYLFFIMLSDKQEWINEYKKIKLALINQGINNNQLDKNKNMFLKLFTLNKTS